MRNGDTKVKNLVQFSVDLDRPVFYYENIVYRLAENENI